MKFANALRGLVAFATLVLLAGCGGGSSTSSPTVGPNMPYKPAPVGRSSTYVVGPPTTSTFALMAGQVYNAGTVTITNDNVNLTVTFTTTGDWRLLGTDLYVSKIPPASAAPGQFTYHHTPLNGVTTDTYTVPLPANVACGSHIYVAAHANLAEYNPVSGIYFNFQTGWGTGDIHFPHSWGSYITYTITPSCPLPTSQICDTGTYPGASSYWGTTLSNVPPGYVVGDGLYVGWCVDLFHYMTPGQPYCSTTLYSTYDPNLPAALQDSDWPKVNYILNHKQGTIQDVQDAIWFFVGGGGTPSTPAGQAMVNDANANGANFVPGPGQVTAVIVYAGPDVQLTIIEVLCNC